MTDHTEDTAYILTLERGGTVTAITIREGGTSHDGGFDVASLINGAARAAGYRVTASHQSTTTSRAALFRGPTRVA